MTLAETGPTHRRRRPSPAWLSLPFLLLSVALVLYPVEFRLEYTPIQSLQAIRCVGLLSVLLLLWAGLLLVLWRLTEPPRVDETTTPDTSATQGRAIPGILEHAGRWMVMCGSATLVRIVGTETSIRVPSLLVRNESQPVDHKPSHAVRACGRMVGAESSSRV